MIESTAYIQIGVQFFGTDKLHRENRRPEHEATTCVVCFIILVSDKLKVIYGKFLRLDFESKMSVFA